MYAMSRRQDIKAKEFCKGTGRQHDVYQNLVSAIATLIDNNILVTFGAQWLQAATARLAERLLISM